MSQMFQRVAVILVLAGCTFDDTFSSCPFSSAMRETCGADEAADYSCVVRNHPQCSQDICLSWKGGESVCTLTCSPGAAGSCPSGSTCTAYSGAAVAEAGAEYFCVQNADLERTAFITTIPGS